MIGRQALDGLSSPGEILGTSTFAQLSELTAHSLTPSAQHASPLSTVAITVLPCNPEPKWWILQCFKPTTLKSSIHQPEVSERGCSEQVARTSNDATQRYRWYQQKSGLSARQTKDLQLKLQQRDFEVKTANKEILALRDLLTQKALSYTTAEQALAATSATLEAVKGAAATAVSGTETALAAMQADLDRSKFSNKQAQQTITRLSAQLLGHSRQADCISPQTLVVLAKLRRVQQELEESRVIAEATLKFAEDLQGIFEQGQQCAAATAVQTESDQRKIDQSAIMIRDLKLQLSEVRQAAEESIPEQLAQSAALFAAQKQLELSKRIAQTTIDDRDAAVLQSVRLQQQLDRAVAEGRKESDAFAADRVAARHETDQLETLLAEIVRVAQAAAPEMAAMSGRMLSAEQQLRDSRHIAHSAVVARDVAEAQLQNGCRELGCRFQAAVGPCCNVGDDSHQ